MEKSSNMMSRRNVIIGVAIVLVVIIILVLVFSMSSDPEVVVVNPSIGHIKSPLTLPNGNYSVSSTYNKSNVVIPIQSDTAKLVNVEIKADMMHVGNTFTIDNSNNPLNPFKVIYTGFDNNQSSDKVDEVLINTGRGILNTVLIQVTVGKTANSKNILITASPMHTPS